jgi:peptidoglycan biosynthesis protein MviN/MurJ (putative lipid II flippase)
MKPIETYLITLVNVLIVFFSPVAGIVLMVAMATLIDTGFGIWRSIKVGQGFSSRKMRFGFVPKLLAYCAAVMLIYASDYYIINDLTQMVVSVKFLSTKLLSLVLISIEVKSMDESFKEVKWWSFLDRMIGLIIKAKNVKKELSE